MTTALTIFSSIFNLSCLLLLIALTKSLLVYYTINDIKSKCPVTPAFKVAKFISIDLLLEDEVFVSFCSEFNVNFKM